MGRKVLVEQVVKQTKHVCGNVSRTCGVEKGMPAKQKTWRSCQKRNVCIHGALLLHNIRVLGLPAGSYKTASSENDHELHERNRWHFSVTIKVLDLRSFGCFKDLFSSWKLNDEKTQVLSATLSTLPPLVSQAPSESPSRRDPMGVDDSGKSLRNLVGVRLIIETPSFYQHLPKQVFWRVLRCFKMVCVPKTLKEHPGRRCF